MSSPGTAADSVANDALHLHHRSAAELTTVELHAILRLRSDVFVVEQNCVYPDVDGRDMEPTTRHLWLEHDGQVAAYLRVLSNPHAVQIGRVVTHPDWRSRGLAARLVQVVLADIDGPWSLEAQSHLADYYASLGFTVCGDEYIEDGIPHVPMHRDVTGVTE